ncbi:hypothetical protein PF003_g8620 [Phytophthora fragariae]|nr:hypothetical protein PF003_g8620 [Phytophthora fragariae]
MHYYVTATSFQRIEDPHLQRAFDICRPGVKLPCRQKLSDELLDACFSEVQEAVDGFLQTPTTHLCVTSDGWSNILNEPIVNYMAVSPDKAVFVESVPTGEKRHTAEWIANDLTRVVRSLGATVSGAITDNTKANKNAWLILEKEFPDKFFHGNSEPRYPDEYPFEPLLTFAQDCNDLVVFFSSHHLLKARLEAAQDAAQKRRLVSPATTRWGSYQRCLVSIKESDSIITGIVADRDFVTGKRKQHLKREAIKSLVNDKDFITKLVKAIAILQPIDEYITKFQSDSVPLSEVYQAFLQLPAKFKAIPGLKKKEIEYLTTRTKHRFTLIYGPAHGIANLLDPRYISDGMPTDFRRGVEDMLFGFPDADGTCTQDRSIQIIREYTQFRVEAVAQRERGDLRFDILGARGDDGVVQKSILQYWQSDCTGWPVLRRIASKVFTMASSSAASERNFSTFGMVHTKNRNRLLPDKVMKLVYIKTNASLLNRPVAKRDSLGPEPASDACI